LSSENELGSSLYYNIFLDVCDLRKRAFPFLIIIYAACGFVVLSTTSARMNQIGSRIHITRQDTNLQFA